MGVRGYGAYPGSTRHVAELMRARGGHVPTGIRAIWMRSLMRARGGHVAHSTLNRWVVQDSPRLEAAWHRRKRPVWGRWRMDETDIKGKGQWRYLSRAVDTDGQP